MKHALVVDDEAEYRRYFCKFLGAYGFNLSEAADGDEALTLARAEKPDIIFMDWCLSGSSSGLEAVRSLRREPGTAPIPVVLMSSLKESAEDEVRAWGAGADFFLDKRDLNPGDERSVQTFLRHMRALMLRGAGNYSPAARTRVYEVADLRLNAANAELVVAGRAVRLPPKELVLLEFFLRHPDALHSAEKIWRLVWGSPHGNWEHTLASAVSSLRKALGFEWSARIINVKAHGYRLALNEPFQPR